MRYIPATPDDVREMLAVVGVETTEELFHTIPEGLRFKGALDLPPALSEFDLMAQLEAIARSNTGAAMVSFLGGGAYSHYIPAVVDTVISRSEFATAYTPYQPEIAQGTLQAVFQLQTYVCELLDMEVANASMYEAASAVAEAALMARRVLKKYSGPERVLLSAGLNPDYRAVVSSYLQHSGMRAEELPIDPVTGATDWQAAAERAKGGAVAVIAQSPNFFGVVEDLAAQRALCDSVGSIMITAVSEALSLGVLKAPGSFGADIVVAEGQSLGIPLSYGGPYCGLFAAKMEYLRALPGRLVGQTTDQDGQRGFVLTLNTREQHIRREKATSNICTNAGLMALAFTTYVSLVGKQGLPGLARLNLSKASWFKRELAKIPGLSLRFTGATFNEFTLRSQRLPVAELLTRMEERGVLLGLPLAAAGGCELSDCVLVAVTETTSRAAMEGALSALKEVCA